MKLKQTLFTFLISCFLSLGFAQENTIIGDWKLEEIELNDFSSEELSFTKEESFFAHYLDPAEILSIQETKIPIVLGGDMHLYDYELKGGTLLLSYLNTVVIFKDGKQEELTKQGETDFKIKISENKLVISRRNETFFESYSFAKLN